MQINPESAAALLNGAGSNRVVKAAASSITGSPPTNDPQAIAELNRLAAELAAEPPGAGVPKTGRNAKLNSVACQLGHYVPHRLDAGHVKDVLRSACDVNGLLADDGEKAFEATFASGLKEGMREPRMPRTDATVDFGDEIAAAEIDRLARLGKVAYERERKAAAKKLGMREAVLDEAVAERRAAAQQPDAQPSWKRETIPWDAPVNGGALLLELIQTIGRYLVLPPLCAETMALWILHAHAVSAVRQPDEPVFEVSAYLTFTSPAPQCGKTSALKIVHRLTPKPLLVSNTTGPVVFRLVETHQPTLLLDEAETYTTDDEGLRGILDAAHDYESASVPRCVGDKHEVTVFRVWCPKAVGLIGTLPDTLMSRSIVVRMQRKRTQEKVERLLVTDRAARATFERLNRQCARWVLDNLDALRRCRPPPLDRLGDRDVDNWTPLLAVAETIGDFWPAVARAAAQQLSGAKSDDEGWRGVCLLRDVRRVFEESGAEKLYAGQLATGLNLLSDAPWGGVNNGRGLDSRSLWPKLRGYLEHRYEDKHGSYYLRAAFSDAWERYCPV